MAETKKTMAEWIAYLDSTTRELTLSEFMALLLWNIRQYENKTSTLAQEQRDGAEHIEAMLGTIDEAMAATNPTYRALADQRAQRTAARALEESRG